ncbi:hypothetical protein [Gloeothece verrucosa]|uniref:Uncharacterized protein n=1 Tax=Gloeothece verrucosa (strain PCC 7822) TaxID=497965 RepID=E0U7D7_GLOV7|nr:hypothetical protein [Gloeothece verrucosa]ADN12524.1 conserved hypothetical protein [Gloeothece verrucosa PCC 7822]
MQLFKLKKAASSTEVKIPKAQRLIKTSSSNVLTLFVLATLGLQGLLFLQTTFNTIWIAKLARKPSPTLVELVDGRSVQVGAQASLYRSPQAIQYFTSQITSMLFSASGTLQGNDKVPTSTLKPTLDPGVELSGNSFRGKRKVTTAAWEASFALSEDFRSTFLPLLAEITPVGVFSGTTQTVLVIDHLSEPEPIEAGKWKLKMIANLYFFTGGDPEGISLTRARIGKAVPVNKDIYVRAVYITPKPLPESATEIQRAVYNARTAGLEIYRFGDLATSPNPDVAPPKK